jgi:dTDP-4-dehydrorhamnose 3,5-epimerase
VEIRKASLEGVLILKPVVHGDSRGHLFESFRADELAAAGLPAFVQENQSFSHARTVRGLHYQLARPQAKLVRVLRGAILDVAVDVRRGSPTFGRWTSELLSAENKLQLYVPPGFAHGFFVLGGGPGEEPGAEVLYKCSDYYSGPADQKGVLWNDAGLGIEWPRAQVVVSDKDRDLLPLHPQREDLPLYEATPPTSTPATAPAITPARRS